MHCILSVCFKTTLLSRSHPQLTSQDDPQGTHSKLIAQAVAQANSGVVQQLLQHSSEVQLKLLEVLRKIGADATQNPPSAYHSFEVQFGAKHMCMS